MIAPRLALCISSALSLVLFAMDAGTTRAQQVAIAPQFDEAGNFADGVAPASLGKLWGLIDHSGAWVVQPRYPQMEGGGDGLFAVQSEGKWGYIDSKGQIMLAPRFEAAQTFEHNVAAVKLSGRWGYIRRDGSSETEFNFLEIGGREGAFVSARDPSGWAVFKIRPNKAPLRVDIEGAERAYSVSEESIIAKFRDGEKLFLIDRLDVNPDEADAFGLQEFGVHFLFSETKPFFSIRRMTEGLAPAATASNKWGYLHRATGEYLWPGRFQDAFGFEQGFAPVKIDGKWSYIDRNGRVVYETTYDAIYPFRGEYAVVREGEKRGFLQRDPERGISVFIKPQFDDAFRFTEGLAPVKVGERWGFVSNGRPWRNLIDTGITTISPQ